LNRPPRAEPGGRISRTGLPRSLALSAIRSSCVDMGPPPLRAVHVSLKLGDSCPPLPPVPGSPGLRVLSAGPTSPTASGSLRCIAFRKTVLGLSQDRRGSPRFPISRSSTLPCPHTPPRSPAASPMAAAYSCLPGIRPCRPSVLDFTRLTRLHLRYGRVVAPPTLSRQRRRCQPKGGFSVGGWPLPRQESHLLQRSSFRPSPFRHHLSSWAVCAWRP
jgi:hypothetical protein